MQLRCVILYTATETDRGVDRVLVYCIPNKTDRYRPIRHTADYSVTEKNTGCCVADACLLLLVL